MLLPDYQGIKDGLVQWVQDITDGYLYQGVDGRGAVWWQEDAWDYQVTPYVELVWQDAGKRGRDEVIYEAIDGDEDNLRPVTVGNRAMFVRVEVRSQGETNTPRIVLELLRSSFDNEIASAYLRENYGVSPISIESYNVMGEMWEGRLEAMGEIEFKFSYTVRDENPFWSIGRVRNVELRNQLRGVDGILVGENVPVVVGLDFPPDGSQPVIRSAFSFAFDVSAFGAAASSDPSTSPFDPDAFNTGFAGIEV